MQYITVKRYKRDDGRGMFNIPYGTELEEHGGTLYHNGKAVCGDRSAVMRAYFRRNDDGRGMEREKLVREIFAALAEKPERWAAVERDGVCQSYRKGGNGAFWLWSIDFFNAEIADLEHIRDIVV